MLVCERCGRENPADARFCAGCGAQVAAAEAAREERKVVSVLFADLVGFTSRAERLDPEDVRATLSPYYARLRQELERFGGTVEKFIGDAVMALFGAPVAHEDDPERAVRAALAVRAAVAALNEEEPGRDLHVRIAVCTGEALVTLGARPSEGEGMAAGDVVNTAARLQSAAPVDGILVDTVTHRATERAIEYRDAPAVEAKGKAEPIPVWEAVEARSRYGVDLSGPGRAELVGRAQELDLLRDALARAREERQPQLVTLVGVPGMGKSRLVWELFKVVDQDPDLIFWRQGRSLPYGEGVAFWALGEMVKAQTGILESDGAAEAEEKLRRSVADLVGEEAETRWMTGHLRPLVGLGGDADRAEDRIGEAFAAWRRYFEALAERGPAVLVFEDMQWADDGLLDFVDALADRVAGVRLLVLCTARPELLERRPGWGGGKRNALTVSLPPLDDTETARLVSALLERSVLPAETQAELLRRAGGNPLYAEEYVRMLADGADAPELPETVQGIIAARLDQLAPEEKALVQDAAVLGKVFWSDGLAALARSERWELEERLHALERKEFVRREARSAVAGAAQYAFLHLLIRDVAYGQLPRAARADRHLRAAAWIETLGGDRSEDRAEMLAHHYVCVLEHGRAGGVEPDLAARACAALADAGARAVALGAYAAADRYHEAALELSDDPHLGLAYGRSITVGAPSFTEGRAEPVLARAVPELLALGDAPAAAEGEMLLGTAEFYRGRRDAAGARFERAVSLVADQPVSRAKVFVLSEAARFEYLAGRAEAAIRLCEEVLPMADELGLDDRVPNLLITMGSARTTLGDREGLALLERAVALADDMNHASAVRGRINLASFLVDLGEVERGREVHAEGLRVAERIGLPQPTRWLRAELAVDAMLVGDWDAAEAMCNGFLTTSEAEPHYMEPGVRGARATIRLARGEAAGAREDAERALVFARGAKDPQVLLPSLVGTAEVELAAGHSERASELVSELFDVCTTSGVGTTAARWSVRLAFVCAALDRGRSFLEARPGLGPPTSWLEAAVAVAGGDPVRAAEILAGIGARPDEAFARICAAEALVAAGRRPEADAQLAAALAICRELGADAWTRRAEAVLAAAG